MRCQAYGGVFPGSPPLDASKYTQCYAMRLDGFVSVAPPDAITYTSNDTLDPSFYHRFRVCARFTGHASITLNGATMETSPAGGYDWTLVCRDVAYLPAGLLPLSVLFVSGPADAANGFQLWVIPVAAVVTVANPVSPPLHAAGRAWPLRLHALRMFETIPREMNPREAAAAACR